MGQWATAVAKNHRDLVVYTCCKESRDSLNLCITNCRKMGGETVSDSQSC